MADTNDPKLTPTGNEPTGAVGNISKNLAAKRGLVLGGLAVAVILLIVVLAAVSKNDKKQPTNNQNTQQTPTDNERLTSVSIENFTSHTWKDVRLIIEGSDQVRLSGDFERDTKGIAEGQQKAVFKIGDFKKGDRRDISIFIKSALKGKQNFLISAKTGDGLLVHAPERKTLKF